MHFDSYPIEIAVSVQGDYHSWLIKPEDAWTHWCETAEEIHGISREKLFDEGETAVAVAEALVEVFRDASGVIYSDADRWDGDWLQTLFIACEMEMPIQVCSLFDLMSIEQQDVFHLNKLRIGRSPGYRLHRALDDVKIIEASFNDALGK